jgi:NitT/TauT family transport system permease protein
MLQVSDALPRSAETKTGDAVPGQWFRVRAPLSSRWRLILGVCSFLIPLSLWSAVSYVPFIWHPDVLISDPGDVDYMLPGMRVDKAAFAQELQNAKVNNTAPPVGTPCNPVYLPAPGDVAMAFYTSFTTPPAGSRRALAASKPLAEHPDDFLGLRDFLADRRAAGDSLRRA